MSWKDTNSASQTIRRNVQSVDVSKEGKVAIEAVMIAHAAAGKMGEFACMMQAIEKTNTQADLASIASDLSVVIRSIKERELQQGQQVQHNTEDTVTLSKEEYDALLNK